LLAAGEILSEVQELVFHPAHSGLSGATATTSRIVKRGRAGATAGYGKNGKLFFDVIAVAIRTVGWRVVARCDVFKIVVAVSTYVFKNWHRLAPVAKTLLKLSWSPNPGSSQFMVRILRGAILLVTL